jgi:hypothetical protein
VAHAEYAWEEGAARHQSLVSYEPDQRQLSTDAKPANRREQDIEDMFCGARQSGTRDVNGYILYFIQDLA